MGIQQFGQNVDQTIEQNHEEGEEERGESGIVIVHSPPLQQKKTKWVKGVVQYTNVVLN